MENKPTARIWRDKIRIPTYEMGAAEKLPIFYKLRINQGTRGGIYPYKMSDKLLMEKKEKEYDAIHLENDYIRVTVLPELGGRIYEGYDKVNRYNFVYKNNVIKPALIGLCGAWCSGGIEFNWPQHHRPTTFMPVECTIEENEDQSKTAWVGETEAMYGLKALVGVTIYPDRSYITAKVKLYNGTPQIQTFHWWANLAVHAGDSYRLMFPPDIDYVTFHNKTTVSPFPVVKGIFGGADFGDGVDIRKYANMEMGSSFFIFNSNYPFMAGYDDSKKMGTVHVADRHISPGKKFFTWGKSMHGGVWQKNLTDEDGDYLEIMTGCYTDNQPDFTWLAPCETKTFEQYWYSLRGLAALKNANKEGAVSVSEEENKIKVAFNVTASHDKVRLVVNEEEREYSAVPGQVYVFESSQGIPLGETRVQLFDENNKELIAWKQLPMYYEEKAKPKARETIKEPHNIDTIEELWLNGLHLEQYKHGVMDPDPYYLEGLRRDPFDIRCNTAMAVLMYRRGRFTEAVPYLENAIKRSTDRNPNPYDTEGFYQLGIIYRQLGEYQKAVDYLKKAAWNYSFRSAALCVAAEIETCQGDYDSALADLEISLETNRHNLRALGLKSAVFLRKGCLEEALTISRETSAWDPLDSFARFTAVLGSCEEEEVKLVEILGNKAGAYLDLAGLYLLSGMYPEAFKAVSLCAVDTPMKYFYLAFISGMEKRTDKAVLYLEKAENCVMDEVFPNRSNDFTVLDYAVKNGSGAVAPYYLGCMHFARNNGVKAVSLWQEAVKRKPEFAEAHRALSLAVFEVYKDRSAALSEMHKAYELMKTPRMFYELYQINKVTGLDNIKLLEMLKDNLDLVFEREDLVLQYIILLNATGRSSDAAEVLRTHSFYTYEGGEGILPRMHAFTYLSLGKAALEKGEVKEALSYFYYALEYPDNYHEGRRYQAKEAHIYYFIAKAYEALKNREKWMENIKIAASQAADMTESEYYRGLAKREYGDYSGAAEIYQNLKQYGFASVKQEGPGFFEGFPTALPFEQEADRITRQRGLTALVLGQLGLGEKKEAMETLTCIKEEGYDSFWAEFIME